MKKKQRFLLKRFAALVAALVICAALCVPCFASNNASTKKWVIVAEEQMTTESGSLGKYFKLSPYANGALYATPVQTRLPVALYSNGRYDSWAVPMNYPDLWRSPIPLGGYTYVELSSISGLSCLYDNSYSHDRYQLIPIHSSTFLQFNTSLYSSGTAFSGFFNAAPLTKYRSIDGAPSYTSLDGAGFSFTASEISDSGFYVRGLLTYKENIQYSFPNIETSYSSTDVDWARVKPFFNCSSDDIVWVLAPYDLTVNSAPSSATAWFSQCNVVISYWIDANKLPAGLKVGDEFPADTDAFDKLRDDLIEQFPEAGDNIENGKDTIQGWNDTETVDTDVASTSISALNAMFQNLGGFLFIISLMVFGAVVLRMMIRKAVDG